MGRPKSKFSQSQLEEMGERVKRIRKGLNLSQGKFAEKIGYQQQIISAIEKGQKPVSLGIAEQIEKAFNIRAAYLMCWDNYKTEEEFADYLLEEWDDICDKGDAFKSLLDVFGYEMRQSGGDFKDTVIDPVTNEPIFDPPAPITLFLVKDGERVCEITPAEEERLQKEIFDFTQFLLEKLVKEKGADNDAE